MILTDAFSWPASVECPVVSRALACGLLSTLLSFSAFAQSGQGEGKLTGPDFSGDYVLLRSTGALQGAAPRELQLSQTDKTFTVIAARESGTWTTIEFPLTLDWIQDGDDGKVKAWFSYGDALITERAIDLNSGYFRQIEVWSHLGNGTIRLCRDAYARTSLWTDSRRSGCATYARR
jgi:hypothetical protein